MIFDEKGEICYDRLTTISGFMATIATGVAIVFPPAAIVTGPIAGIAGMVFSWATNKGKVIPPPPAK